MYWTSLYFYDRADFYLKSYLHFHSKSSYITWACSGKKFLNLICLEQHNTNLSFLIVVYYQGQCHQKIYGLWDFLWNISHKKFFRRFYCSLFSVPNKYISDTDIHSIIYFEVILASHEMLRNFYLIFYYRSAK